MDTKVKQDNRVTAIKVSRVKMNETVGGATYYTAASFGSTLVPIKTISSSLFLKTVISGTWV